MALPVAGCDLRFTRSNFLTFFVTSMVPTAMVYLAIAVSFGAVAHSTELCGCIHGSPAILITLI